MVHVKHNYSEYLKNIIKTRKFICFGAGKQLSDFLETYVTRNNVNNLVAILDSFKAGESIQVQNKMFQIQTADDFAKLNKDKNIVILITNIKNYVELVEQLDKVEAYDGMECYIEHIIFRCFAPADFEFQTSGITQIEKKIHYCWFGGTDIPKHLQEYVDTWKKYCPDYEIIRWDESNYDISKNKFMKKAYEERKWAFVPDYARLDIIYQHGGFYLDTDVELIKSLDCLRGYEMYLGFDGPDTIGMGVGFGARKGHRLLRKMMDIYDEMTFEADNMVSSNVILTDILKTEGILINNEYQQKDDFVVFPSEVLTPFSYDGLGCGVTDKSISIHHNEGSWIDNMLDIKIQIEERNRNYFEWIERRKTKSS